MFGKSIGQYLRFQKVILALIFVVWLLRLILSLTGTPVSIDKYVSVTVVVLIGVLYYGVAVHTSGFGSYKQLYPLALFQSLFSQGLIALAIVYAIFTGHDNIYTVPEFSGGGDGKVWFHAFAHFVLAGLIVLPLISWAVSSLVMLITKAVAKKPEPRTA